MNLNISQAGEAKVDLFSLSGGQWQAMAPFMPKSRTGARGRDGRTTLSGVQHVVTGGCRRKDLREEGISVVVPGTRDCKIRLDKRRSRDRWRIGAVSCRPDDFRRIATRDDKRDRGFGSRLAAIIAVWC